MNYDMNRVTNAISQFAKRHSMIKSGFDDGTCCICLSSFKSEPNRFVTKLSCGHVMHKDCIEQWLKSNQQGSKLCPHCKKEIKAVDFEPENPKKKPVSQPH